MAIRNEATSEIRIIPYNDTYYTAIHEMYLEEGWMNLAENYTQTQVAWKNSSIAFLAITNDEEVVACMRGFTDTLVTTFICEMLVEKKFRGHGIGKGLLNYVHALYPSTRIEMLATEASSSFYEKEGYRSFYGFRKSF
ncbi:GNAT family N-acetyltransferase [Sporosarcina aquimarina]|uniref:GNAT family N-acetyltransferase n=1 Tax=Sporosarcina aquimarina TaxID=114975 RepID=UPI002040B91E|nr:GNAT family N-acetyltransferase [Sporosarcina aquimarina]MCM3758545.1 GNAT family N-acetyltransferase [Sporosarcina aquimarina]